MDQRGGSVGIRVGGKAENTIDENHAIWNDQHAWPSDGDEWNGSAKFCGQPYDAWKDSLVETFLLPHLTPTSRVLEIAPGHGRWSSYLVEQAAHVDLVDLSESCISFCRDKFADRTNVDYHVNDGSTLPVPDASVDFVWSFDSFVHMAPDVIATYLREISRVLRPGGQAVLHHAGRRHGMLWLGGLRGLGTGGRYAYKLLSIGHLETTDGWRSNVSGRGVRSMADAAGLEVLGQTRRWGPAGEYTVERFNDWVTTFRKP
jgi:SAM-dependent methyltransferase